MNSLKAEVCRQVENQESPGKGIPQVANEECPGKGVQQMRAYLHRLEGVGGVILSNQANDEPTPQASAHTEEQVPVLDHAVLLLSENSGELLGQRTQADRQHSLQ